jgi:hypothetical protein
MTMYKAKVRCTLILDVVVEASDAEHAQYLIEDYDCPGTGAVGAELERVMRETPLNICWACNLQGENKLLELEPIP